MKKISPSVIVIALFCLGFSLSFWKLVVPQVREVTRLRNELDAITAQANPLGGNSATQRAERERLQNLKDSVETLLPVEGEQYDLSVQIEALVKGMGMPLSSLVITDGAEAAGGQAATAASTAGEGSLSPVGITIATAGRYSDIQRLVQGLVSLERFIAIDSLSLSPQTAAPAASAQTGTVAAPAPVGDSLTAQISASAYYLPSSGKGEK